MEKCVLCPRNCAAERDKEKGFCGEGKNIRVVRAAPHYWEEPCVSGENGSGTVFFSGCSLRCVYCQNRAVSRSEYGKEVSEEELSDIFLRLAQSGVHNINLVTPTHFTPQIARAVGIAKTRGLNIPVIWNSSGYEKAETLRSLEGLIDVYLPDFKYRDPVIASRDSSAPDYFDAAKAAVSEMLRQTGAPVFEGEMIKRGVIVRHLVLPGCVEDSKAVLKYLHENLGDEIYISVMNQYTPIEANLSDELNRRLSDAEYDEAVEYALSIGVKNGFVQEGDTAKESFIPSFDYTGV